MTDLSLPPLLQQRLVAEFGELTAVLPLYGFSRNQVWRLQFSTVSWVVKASTSAAELRFYQQVAPLLRQQGVAVPDCWGWHSEAGVHWVVVQFVPHPFSQSRWLADGEALALLRRLHSLRLDEPPVDCFRPQWTAVMTMQALALLDGSVADERLLRRLEALSQPLFAGQQWLSGDPNPKNWGVGANGRLYLFDWERFGRGDVAIDLAITVPGLPPRCDFERVGRGYLLGEKTADLEMLVEKMLLAKVWTIVEFLSAIYNEEVEKPTGIESITAVLWPWLNTQINIRRLTLCLEK